MNKYFLTLGFFHDLAIDFKRLGHKISDFMNNYTDNVWAGTIIFIVLMFLAFAFIKGYTKK